MKRNTTLSIILALSLSGLAPVCTAMDMGGMDMSAHAQPDATEAVGIVEAIDADGGAVTISHEPIKSLDWPAMTMDFTLKDKKLMRKLGKGKKIRFMFIEQRGEYVITGVK